MLVGAFADVNEKVLEEIERCRQRWNFRTFTQSWSGTTEVEQYSQRQTGCRLAGAQSGTWIMHTDLDIILVCQPATALISWQWV